MPIENISIIQIIKLIDASNMPGSDEGLHHDFFFFFKKQNTLFKILNVNNNKIINYTKLKAMLAGNDQYKKPC